MIGRTVGVLENEPRTVVSIYYPASSGSGVEVAGVGLYAPCMSEAESVLAELGVERGMLPASHRFVQDGQSAIVRERLPVIILAPGFGVERDMYQGLIAKLVPQRYIVVTVGAPHESVMTVFPDGTIIRQRAEMAAMEDNDIEEWQRLLDIRAAWIIRVLRYLDDVNRKDDRLAGVLDLDRVAVAGHSLGGAAAYESAQRDLRVKAVVMLDPSFQLIRRGQRPSVPVLVLRQEASTYEAMIATGFDEELAHTYIEGQRFVAHGACRLFRVTGANHMSFSDIPLHYGDDHAVPVHDAASACIDRFLTSTFAGDGEGEGEDSVDILGSEGIIPIDADGQPIRNGMQPD